eukprot:3940016-Rhodomonas_salina.1
MPERIHIESSVYSKVELDAESWVEYYPCLPISEGFSVDDLLLATEIALNKCTFYSLDWQQGYIKLFGKIYAEPRKTCYFAEHVGQRYHYSTRSELPLNYWHNAHPVLLKLKKQVEGVVQGQFNTALWNM